MDTKIIKTCRTINDKYKDSKNYNLWKNHFDKWEQWANYCNDTYLIIKKLKGFDFLIFPYITYRFMKADRIFKDVDRNLKLISKLNPKRRADKRC